MQAERYRVNLIIQLIAPASEPKHGVPPEDGRRPIFSEIAMGLDTLREAVLNELWEALSISAARDDIPMEAQLKADRIEALIDMIIAEVLQGREEYDQPVDQRRPD